MLVLSRRSKQSIVIGGRIKVTVLAITGHQVEIGVEAPLHIAVDREEIHVRKQGRTAERSAKPIVTRVLRQRPQPEQPQRAESSAKPARGAINGRGARNSA